MIKNYFKSLFRSFKQRKVFTLINIGGLTLGITCSLIMFLIVKHEVGYDNFQENKDRLYRIVTTGTTYGNVYHRVGTPRPLVKAVREDIAGLEAATMFVHRRYGVFKVTDANGEEKEYTERNGLVYAEASLFDMFTWEWIEGEGGALSEPNTVVLDDENANKMFGDESPMGKTIRFNNADLEVVGVVKKRPERTDFPFAVFISMPTFEATNDMTVWGNTSSNERTYVMLNPGVAPESVNAQFPDFVTKYFGEKSTNELSIQSLNEVHFDSLYGNLNYRSISKNFLTILSVVCVFIVVTACFNFINMSTAMAIKRSKEVGIRKVLGSTRKRLVSNFLLETGLITVLSVILSLAITERLLPTVVKDFTSLDLSLNLLSDYQLLIYLGVLIVFVTMVAGLYPAWIISAFQPAQVLRGTGLRQGDKKMGLRRLLVTFQFALSQVFIFGTLVAIWQMQYVRNTDLGYERDFIVYLELPGGADKVDVWRGELPGIASVENFSFSQTPPFSGSTSSTDARYDDENGLQSMTTFLKPADSKYLETYGIELIAGENLLDTEKRNRFLVNETFVKKMGVQPEEALGVMVEVGGHERVPISGVVKDFHLVTLRDEIKPVVLYSEPNRYRTLGIKFSEGSADRVLADLESTWDQIHPDRDFRYRFFDEYLGQYYTKEKKFSEMLTTFASIAIFICCLGLYGLVSYMANQKIKEIGIRKVLGASIRSIMSSFSLEFVRLVALAFLIAAPIAYYGMQGWLNTFVYRIEIGPAIFILGIVLSLVVTVITTGYRSFKAARSNPVDSLRSE